MIPAESVYCIVYSGFCVLNTRHHKLISRDRLAKCGVIVEELTKIPFTFSFAAWSFLLKGIGVVFEDYSIGNKIRNIAYLYSMVTA